MQRLLSILGPIPFMALAILAAGCGLGVAIFVFQCLSIQMGEKAKVLASSFVLPNTKIPAGETWAGIPARNRSPVGVM